MKKVMMLIAILGLPLGTLPVFADEQPQSEQQEVTKDKKDDSADKSCNCEKKSESTEDPMIMPGE